MRHERDWLLDILDAADRIAVRVQRGREAFDGDEDLQLAMARLIENIGEACARLGHDVWQRYPDVPWRSIAGMRNRVVHGYFDIDLDLVWVACEREVPTLAARVRAIVDELPEGDADGDE